METLWCTLGGENRGALSERFLGISAPPLPSTQNPSPSLPCDCGSFFVFSSSLFWLVPDLRRRKHVRSVMITSEARLCPS